MEFVYKLVDDTDIPFYVGITNNPNARLQQHMTENPRVQELQKKVRMQFIEILDTREKAQKREKFWILEYLSQGFPLTNIQYVIPVRKQLTTSQLNRDWQLHQQTYSEEDKKATLETFLLGLVFACEDDNEYEFIINWHKAALKS